MFTRLALDGVTELQVWKDCHHYLSYTLSLSCLPQCSCVVTHGRGKYVHLCGSTERRSLHACTCPLCTWSHASPYTTVLPIMNHRHGHSYIWPCKSWRPLAHFRYCDFLIFFIQIKLTHVDAYGCHFQGSFLSLRLWRHPTRCLQSVAAAVHY